MSVHHTQKCTHNDPVVVGGHFTRQRENGIDAHSAKLQPRTGSTTSCPSPLGMTKERTRLYFRINIANREDSPPEPQTQSFYSS